MLLVDANVWLELLLEQERAEQVRDLLRTVPLAELAITDFALHSVGIILARNKEDGLFVRFISDLLLDTDVRYLSLDYADLMTVAETRDRLHLDFDDAYQYVAAEKYDLTLVSLDADFDRTERGRKTPAEILGEPPVARDRPPRKPARRRNRKP
ncbi:PIN domain-containing protein [candidate division WOR-3 bacterium]|uniref:PIN domain-containing protein n=1 Tax=candidate division WOR-3 bacterium TaxID=2052148 RepID=A0A938BS24_UNCW3|nr:PIN domain-containing protein [candidate division WOR-3 bacterium]